jgi:hypothetical protein
MRELDDTESGEHSWRPFVPEAARSARRRPLVRVMRRIYLVVGLAVIFVAWDLLRGEQGPCVAYCTPAARAFVLTVVGGGCGLLALACGARRGAVALLVLAIATVPWVMIRITV